MTALLRTDRDLSDPENVKDADHYLRRAMEVDGVDALAIWARDYGVAAIEVLKDRTGGGSDEDLTDDNEAMTEALSSIEKAAGEAIIELDDIDPDDPKSVGDGLRGLRSSLEDIAKIAAQEA